MRYLLIQVGVLTAVVLAVVALGRGYCLAWWGPAGGASLTAAAWIAWAGAVIAVVPFALAVALWREMAAQAAFAGTAVRVLATGGAALAYQAVAHPHLESFLASLLVLYLALLAVETTLLVLIGRRLFARPAAKSQ